METENLNSISLPVILHWENKYECTMILIAHKLNTIVSTDNIVVLENGKVIEQGDHNHLMNIEGRYFAMQNKVEMSAA